MKKVVFYRTLSYVVIGLGKICDSMPYHLT